MFDLLITGGRAVTPHGVTELDIAVRDGRIVSIAAPGTLGDEARHTIDAEGKIVIPGGIDPHIHCKWIMPDPKGGAPGYSGAPAQVSRAALFGGTTTLIDFVMWNHGQTIQQAIEQRVQNDWAGQCYSDYALHIMLQGAVPPDIIDQIPETIQAGFPSIKIFTTDITPSRRGRKILFGHIWEILQRTARHGGIAAIHAEDDDIVMYMYDKVAREGRTAFENLPEVHNTLSEDLSFRRIIRLAERIEGAALYMMHVSAADGVQAIADSRAKGYPIYGETLHQYALYTSEAYLRPNGQIYHTYPSLKSEEDTRKLWEGMADGTISTVATDGICTSLEVKVQGRKVDDVTGGNAGVEPRVGIIYTEAVERRGFSLEQFVDLVSTNAAKLLGLYPRKGALAVGSDADIVILDPSRRRTLRKEDLHETDYSPWEGWEVAAWPVTTVLRGKVVVHDGAFYGDQNDGQLVERKIADRVLRGATG